MGSPGSTSNSTLEDVRGVFSRLERRCAPITASEAAEELGCSCQAAREGLEELEARGEVRTKMIDGAARVWWRPEGSGRARRDASECEEFTAFVNAVEEYAIFKLDPDGVVASWNEGAERIKGYEREEILGEHVSTFYTDEDVEEGVPERNLAAAAREGHAEDEGWRVRSDGSRFWADVTITAVRDDDGSIRGFTKVTRDMTEWRKQERQLLSERDVTERILETVPVGICLLSSDGEFVRVNRRLLDRLGVERADLEGDSVDSWELYDADGEPVPRSDRPWARVAETGRPVYEYECRIDVPNRGRRWFSLDAAPVDDGRSGDGSVVVSLDDVTDRKERERRLRREYDQTEKLLRTAPIAISVQNAAGETVMANRRVQETLGLPEEEFASPDHDEWAVYDSDGEPVLPDEMPSARVLATGEPVLDEELVFVPPGGERIHVCVNAAPLFGPDGTVERVISAGEDITELKRRERQLRRRKEELETEVSEILGRISDAFYALDDEWRFTHLNERAAEIMQHSREELLGRTLWEAFPEAESVYREQFDAAMETQEPVTFEVYARNIGAWLEFNAYPSASGLSIYFRDVTERKARENALAKYETIVETVKDGIYVKDDEGRFTMVNEAYAEMTGYSREELVGAHASIVVDEETLERAAKRKAAMRVDEAADRTMEAMVRTKSGDLVPAEATFSTIETNGGREEQVGVVRDISDRKEYQRKIEESERRYRTLAENFPNGIVALFDEDLRYVAAGGELLGELGIEREAPLGMSIHERYPDELVAEVEPYFRAALDGEENPFEVEYYDRNLLAHTLPIKSSGGAPAGMLVVQDVTRRREYQRQLEESNERLEQFAYAASHDLQEPLRMVSSYLQLIDDRYRDELDEDGREFIEFAVDGAERMRDMIDALLQYSRVETRGDEFETVDLDAVVDDVRDDLQIQIEETDADVSVEPLPRVEGDPNQLRQVFQNLLDNAIAYSGDDPPEVRVSADRVGSYWHVAVRDEGIGVDPDDAERIFEVFQRLHTHDEHAGTGIGLALCERIVERHGGRIWVDSEPGEGSTFTFTLPVDRDADD
jgi:PAS domain S-box-containing protein